MFISPVRSFLCVSLTAAALLFAGKAQAQYNYGGGYGGGYTITSPSPSSVNIYGNGGGYGSGRTLPGGGSSYYGQDSYGNSFSGGCSGSICYSY